MCWVPLWTLQAPNNVTQYDSFAPGRAFSPDEMAPSATLEIAPGFHFSDSRILGRSIPSNLFSMDWLVKPLAPVIFCSSVQTAVAGSIA